MSSAQLPRELSELFSTSRKCLRCGETFIELNNIGRWRCSQSYHMYGISFSVAADHMPSDDKLNRGRSASEAALRSAWYLYQYDENSDIVIDSRYSAVRPDPRAVVMNTDGSDTREEGQHSVRQHYREIVNSGADKMQSPQLLRAMALCASDDDGNGFLSDDDDDDESEDSFESDDGEFEESSSRPMTSFTKQIRIRRYNWLAVCDYMRNVVPRAKRAHEMRSEDVPKVMFEKTRYSSYPEYISKVYGLGYVGQKP